MNIGVFEKNKVYCMDCIAGLKKIPDNSIDLIVTDPPYNIGVTYGAYKDKKQDYVKWCAKWLKQCERVLKNNGSLYFINYPEQMARIFGEFNRATKLIFRNWITWHYPTNIGCSPKNFTRSQRSIIFYTKGNRFKFNLEEGEVVQDLLEFNLVKNTSKEKVKGFPNQIPEKLMELLIELSSNKGDLIVDPFGGSGTTAMACKTTGRDYILFEIDENNTKIIKKRISNDRLKPKRRKTTSRRITR